MNFKINTLDHVAIEVTDVEAAISFYTEIVGLVKKDTPDSVRSGGVQWMGLTDSQDLHLVERKDASPSKIGHFALVVDDVEIWKKHFEAAGFPTSKPMLDLYEAERFFVYDPYGNRMEFLKWN